MTGVKILLSKDGRTFRHQKEKWSSDFPIERLDSWIAFYRRLSKKRPQFYKKDLAALLLFKAKVSKR